MWPHDGLNGKLKHVTTLPYTHQPVLIEYSPGQFSNFTQWDD